eukprot:1350574-Amorphochlora_amoeboformis.AAC.1
MSSGTWIQGHVYVWECVLDHQIVWVTRSIHKFASAVLATGHPAVTGSNSTYLDRMVLAPKYSVLEMLDLQGGSSRVIISFIENLTISRIF